MKISEVNINKIIKDYIYVNSVSTVFKKSDSYTWDSWGDPEYCDTVFVVHEHHDKNVEAPFGVTVRYED